MIRRRNGTVSVMHVGKQVDCGPVETGLAAPTSPYTRELIEAIPGKRALRAEAEPARMSG